MSKAPQFKEGDIVQLKSGGPKMTVQDPDYGDSITCSWFAGSKLENGVFKPNTLQHYVETEKK